MPCSKLLKPDLSPDTLYTLEAVATVCAIWLLSSQDVGRMGNRPAR